MTIGKKIKKCRIEKKLTQEYLAEKLNVTRQAVSKWENENTLPNMENLIELANIFQVPLSELTDTREIEEDKILPKCKKKYLVWMISIACGVVITAVLFGWIMKLSIVETVLKLEDEVVITSEDEAVITSENIVERMQTEEMNTKLTFSGYTGYLDECIECNQKSKFTRADYDEDGLIDRVYRTMAEDEQAMYKIEFGNGEVLELEEEMPDGGFPYILSGDFTGDNRNDIVFGVMHGDSTAPQAYGEIAFFTSMESGYKSLRSLENDKEAYQNELPFYYEKVGDYTLKVICPSPGFELLIDIDPDIWNDYQYEDYFVGQEVRQCIYQVYEKQNNDGTVQLIGKVRLIDKWNIDEVNVEILYQNGILSYGKIYQEEIETTSTSLFLFDQNNISMIEIIDGNTGVSYKVPDDKCLNFIKILNETSWIQQESSGGISDYNYSVKVFDANDNLYFSELIFRTEEILNMDGYFWLNTLEQIPFEEYLMDK